jgi:hypothetical protein
MADRNVTDSAGRTWMCISDDAGSATAGAAQGKDVVVSCSTPSVKAPVTITVGWNWISMSANGLARIISQASPVPRR